MNFKIKAILIASCLASGMLLATTLLAASDTDGDGVPDTAEPLLHTDQLSPDTDGDGFNDLHDDNPVFLTDPIDQSGGKAPFVIQELLVENNYDYIAQKDSPDHLEIELINNSEQLLTDFSIYYTIKNLDNNTMEAYFKKLDGYTLPARGDARLHFDISGLPGHFRANPNSIYLTDSASKLFHVELKAAGYKPVTASLNKDAGGTEEAD